MTSVDIALLGATGFTGALAAEHLGARLPTDGSWAIAGRNRDKLVGLARRIEATGGTRPQIIEADVTDDASLAALARQTRILVSAVGPYAKYGLPVAGAAAEAGIGYLDLAGEPAFVDAAWLTYNDIARATGARLIHAAGFDCVPFDLGVLHVVDQLPDDVPITVRGYLRARVVPSGGTVASVLGIATNLRASRTVARRRRNIESGPIGRKIGGGASFGRAPHDRGWRVPLPTLDPLIVQRSARALESYGPDFRYQHFAHFRSPLVLAGAAVGAVVGGAAVQLPPVRSLIGKTFRPGEGPSDAARAKSWFTLDLLAETPSRRLHTRVSGRDPGYGGAAAILAESAMCLAFDELPEVAGQVTTAVALGHQLIDRLSPDVLTFETL